MLVTTELVRDVLCDQVIQLSKLEGLPQSAAPHIHALSLILSSDDFQQVTDPDDVWLTELKEFCKQKRKEQ